MDLEEVNRQVADFAGSRPFKPNELFSEFKKYVGHGIALAKFGFSSFEEFLLAAPNVIPIDTPDGKLFQYNCRYNSMTVNSTTKVEPPPTPSEVQPPASPPPEDAGRGDDDVVSRSLKRTSSNMSDFLTPEIVTDRVTRMLETSGGESTIDALKNMYRERFDADFTDEMRNWFNIGSFSEFEDFFRGKISVHQLTLNGRMYKWLFKLDSHFGVSRASQLPVPSKNVVVTQREQKVQKKEIECSVVEQNVAPVGNVVDDGGLVEVDSVSSPEPEHDVAEPVRFNVNIDPARFPDVEGPIRFPGGDNKKFRGSPVAKKMTGKACTEALTSILLEMNGRATFSQVQSKFRKWYGQDLMTVLKTAFGMQNFSDIRDLLKGTINIEPSNNSHLFTLPQRASSLQGRVSLPGRRNRSSSTRTNRKHNNITYEDAVEYVVEYDDDLVDTNGY